MSCYIRTSRAFPAWISLFWRFWILFLLFSLPSANAQTSPVNPSDQPGSTEAIKTVLQKALASEQSALEEMDNDLERWKALQQRVSEEIEAYGIQNTAHANLLLVSQTRVEDLETALNNNRLMQKSLQGRIEEFEKIGTIAADRMARLADRIAIAEKQKKELQREGLPDSEKLALREQVHLFLDLLIKKQKQSQHFLKTYEDLFNQLKQLMNDLKETRNQLEDRLKSQVAADLFKRAFGPFTQWQGWQAEWTAIRMRSKALFSADFWHLQWLNVQRGAGITQVVFLALFITAVILRKRIRDYLADVDARMEGPAYQMRRIAVIMLRRSFMLICAALLLWLYDALKLPHANYRLGRLLNQLVITLLFWQWSVNYLRLRWDTTSSDLHAFAQQRLVNLVRRVGTLIVVYLLIASWFGSESLPVWMVRLAVEVTLLISIALFWRDWGQLARQVVRHGEATPATAQVVSIRIWSYLVAGGALLMELTGYNVLAPHWLVSWVKTLMIAMWASISWLSIQEWHASQKAAYSAESRAGGPERAGPLVWFMVQMARLIWFSLIIAGGLLVWSSSDVMINILGKMVDLSFAVGSLRLSVKGLLLAVIILLLTHVLTRIGRRLLSEKVLDTRDFERGLKDSIITITTYVVWGLGLILALGVLGVDATSLAVVFGALSIGIGFGLQNIFNNFISGLILLFERPIQVGDCVEVNGIWAEVKKINVRSTIVQTFDNATLIIPNSDFISQQVTNWSFKDPRMRRNVDVGVAYGSDVELVRQTLLEIAAATRDILNYPRPDVLFMDHGDSALIFRLRFWTHLDNYYSTTTDVRFELDRRFRERNIEIAFPQRDIHIRSSVEEK
ncbi:putative Small-conductance mechanosensitive channel [Desulfosarcina cetonica]|nr:putative Small-conductance mechanosensitive channel [Desulfosarcina cetonica]